MLWLLVNFDSFCGPVYSLLYLFSHVLETYSKHFPSYGVLCSITNTVVSAGVLHRPSVV